MFFASRCSRALAFALLAGASTLTWFGPAVAQSPAPAPTTPAPAAAPSASHLALAREVLLLSGIARNFDGLVPQVIEQLRGTISRQRPELIRDLEQIFLTLGPEMSAKNETLVQVVSRLYANRLTEPELREIAAFFKSPAGLRYTEVQPVLLQEVFVEMQIYSQTLGNIMVDRLREELKKRGHDF